MKIMFNGLDRSFEFSNLRYGREIREILCFVKHHSLTHINIYSYYASALFNLCIPLIMLIIFPMNLLLSVKIYWYIVLNYI
jgi:hypothetical protein